MPIEGLTTEQALQLQSQFGFNELPQMSRQSWLRVAIDVVKEPMLLLLLVSALLYLFFGDATEALLLLGSALVVIGINLIQDLRSERALDALKDLTRPKALVIRDGTKSHISTRELVPGDLLIISEGDRLGADATLVESRNLLVDESLITGESIAIEKDTEDASHSFLFSGSLVVRGYGRCTVTHTGIHSEIGKIGRALSEASNAKTQLELQTRSFVRSIASMSLLFCVLIAILYGLTRGGWIEASLTGVSLAMSLLPEEFPVILAIFLALGARRLSGSGILIRRLPAVEALGTVTVLCVDKTGTLTRNEMSLVELRGRDGSKARLEEQVLPTSFEQLLEASVLASHSAGFDPMDRAVIEASKRSSIAKATLTLIQERPIAPNLPIFTNVWHTAEGQLLTCKGAPEAVLALCTLTAEEELQALASLRELAEQGLRVLAVATATSSEDHAELFEYDFKYLGLLAFADPIRAGISESVKECYSAGIRVIMITGDYPVTARTIAQQAGIHNAHEVLTGTDIEALNALELSERIKDVNVYARVTPSQKLELVELLKEQGEIVAMTGDGVNDAPALKAAHIGVAMGGRGTDVAREASAVILTKDDFTSLVLAVRLGRRTCDNIKKAMYYVIAMHFPVAGLALLPLLTGLPIIFYPIHIVLIELLLDPISSLVFEAEPEEPTVMQRPPRDSSAPIFQRRNLVYASLQGIGVLIACATVYLYSYSKTHSEFEARTLTFSTLLLANLALAVINRSWTTVFLKTLKVKNNVLWWSLGSGLMMLLLITQVRVVSQLFHFGPFHFDDWIACSLAAALSVTWFELLKLFSHKRLVV